MKNEHLLQKIQRHTERNFEEQLSFLSELVSFKSLVGHEGEAQRVYAKACRELGLKVELFEAEKEKIKNHPAYIEIGLDYTGRPNVVTRTNGSTDAPSLILNGHMDVVSP